MLSVVLTVAGPIAVATLVAAARRAGATERARALGRGRRWRRGRWSATSATCAPSPARSRWPRRSAAGARTRSTASPRRCVIGSAPPPRPGRCRRRPGCRRSWWGRHRSRISCSRRWSIPGRSACWSGRAPAGSASWSACSSRRSPRSGCDASSRRRRRGEELAMMLVLVLGLAWGALAATPLAVRARRQGVDLRLRPLHPVRAAPARTPPVLLRRVVDPLSVGVVGRVLAGARARHRARRDRAALGAELPVTLDLLGVAVGAGCTPYLAVDMAARWAPPGMAARLAGVQDACALGATFAEALDDVAARSPPLRPLADAPLASDPLA